MFWPIVWDLLDISKMEFKFPRKARLINVVSKRGSCENVRKCICEHTHKHTYAQSAGKIRISTSIIGGACRITHWMNIIEAIQDIFRRVRAPFTLLSYRLRSVWLSQNCQCAHYIVGYAKLKTLRWLLEWTRVKLCYLQSFFPNKRQVGRMANDERK